LLKDAVRELPKEPPPIQFETVGSGRLY